jgi:hypothetical protein
MAVDAVASRARPGRDERMQESNLLSHNAVPSQNGNR